jgi:hypothetical protein
MCFFGKTGSWKILERPLAWPEDYKRFFHNFRGRYGPKGPLMEKGRIWLYRMEDGAGFAKNLGLVREARWAF